MKTKLTLSRPDGTTADLVVTVDADCTVGALADRIGSSDPKGAVGPGLTIVRGGHAGSVTLPRSSTVLEAGLASGTAVALAQAAPDRVAGGDVAAVLTVHSGPDVGRTFDLRPGANFIGRGRQCAVQLSDPMVSTTHARVHIGETIELTDENSSNGILMGGQQVSRVTLTEHDQVVLGEDVVSISLRGKRIETTGGGSLNVEFNRSPRVAPPYEGPELIAPEPPGPPQPQRFPVAQSLMPLFMGVVLFLVMDDPKVVVFIALSPLLMVASWWESRRAARKAYEEAVNNFRANLAELNARLRTCQDQERVGRDHEHPGTSEVVDGVARRGRLLWTRRPEHVEFMELRLGLGTQPSRVRIDSGASRNATPELAAELAAVVDRFAVVERVPIVGSFDRSGSIGVSGPGEGTLSVARGLLLQLVGLHSPAELVVCGVASAVSASRWDWIKWLPHTSSDHTPLSAAHLSSTPPGCSNLVAEISDLVSARLEQRGGDHEAPPLPRVVLLVEDDAPVDRNRLVSLAERGPSVGVHLLWISPDTASVPAACRTFVEIDATNGTASTGRVVEGELSHPVLVEPVDASNAIALARSLAPVVDAGALPDDQSDLPSTVSFLADAGMDLASTPSAILDRWTESQSLFVPGAPRPRQRRDAGLRALVGRGKGDNVYLDLRTQGPHALVGGTTGAGKSEFLQTWILGMATAHSPQRVTFLFVDYKGGSAFADCVKLPHSVGLVTDLSPHLVQRALTSLNAELRYREHVLNRKKAKDLLELERRNDPETPPSLVIVVDEFAALVQEVPEFVDGVVNVAQRGRSLGLHLILATQRPAGVIKDNLRANTNLRVALRMADEEDSKDVVGTAQAGTFDPGIPGRGIAKTGPGRLTLFQSGYVGGWTSATPPPARIDVESLEFGATQPWEAPSDPNGAVSEADPGPSDIQCIVATVTSAAEQAQLEAPRKPWLPELSKAYDLAALPLPRRDSELVFGVVDQPHDQQQGVALFRPDVDGNIAVFGTGGSGKSTLLRTLAVGAGLTARGGPCFVYGLDFGARGLSMLDSLPHVGSIIGADDTERTVRLMAQLRDAVEERAARFAKVNAGTIDEYRRLAGKPDEPRVLLLVDGFSAFRSAYEVGPMSAVFDQLLSIAGDGRPVGVHVVISADRLGAVPAALSGAVQKKLALRLSNEMDEAMLNVPRDGFGAAAPPGRGFIDGAEVQVAVFGGSRDVAAQAGAIEKLGESMRRAGAAVAPAVERLPELVTLGELSAAVDGLPVFGMADGTLGPIGFEPTGMFLVAGPSGSGRTSTVRTVVAAVRRSRPDARFVYFGQRRSPLATMPWDRAAVGVADSAALAEELAGEWRDGQNGADEFVIVLDGVGEYLNSDADYPLQDLLKVCRSNGNLVVADGDTSDVQGSWPLLQMIKAPRHGIVLQPDQTDGDALFRTQFSRMSRADFPPGRGMYVRNGRATRVQVAMT